MVVETPVEMVVETPVEMVTEAAEISGDMTAEAYPLVEESCAPANSEPEIEVMGDMVALGAGRFRLPLVIRLGDREVKTALSLDVSFEKPGLS
jgi:hypothetical protein